MEKRVEIKFIHQIIKQYSYDSIYDRLQEFLGEDGKIFAKRIVGHEFYSWEDNSMDWKCITSANSTDSQYVYRAIQQHITNIRCVLQNHTQFKDIVDSVTTVPNDDFIFYSIDNTGNYHIILTAWGYKYPAKAVRDSHNGKIGIRKQQNVVLIFTDNNRGITNAKFIFNRSGRKIVNVSGADGKFEIGKMQVGDICDIEVVTPRSFVESFEVEKGKEEYVIDLTIMMKAKVFVNKDGVPQENTSCVIEYNNNAYELKTNELGVAEVDIPYINNQKCLAIVDNKSLSQVVDTQSGIQFTFDLISEVIPVIRVIDHNQNIISDYPITISYSNTQQSYISDLNGEIHLESMTIGSIINCIDEKNTDNRRSFETQISNPLFLFEIDNNEDLGDNSELNAFIRVVNDKGNVPNYPIKIKHQGIEADYITDDNGCVYLNTFSVNDTLTVFDGNNRAVFTEYLLNENQDEYLFKLESELKPPIDELIKIHLFDENNMPVQKGNLFIQQRRKPKTTVPLNEEGVGVIVDYDVDFSKKLIVGFDIPSYTLPNTKIKLINGVFDYKLYISLIDKWWNYIPWALIAFLFMLFVIGYIILLILL